MKLGRRLTPNESADHKDGDRTNDHPDNIQLLEWAEHQTLDAVRRVLPVVECVWCGGSFQATRHNLEKRKKSMAGPFCSRKCRGQYGANIAGGGA